MIRSNIITILLDFAVRFTSEILAQDELGLLVPSRYLVLYLEVGTCKDGILYCNLIVTVEPRVARLPSAILGSPGPEWFLAESHPQSPRNLSPSPR